MKIYKQTCLGIGFNKDGFGSGWFLGGTPAGKCLWQACTADLSSENPRALAQRLQIVSSLDFLVE